MEKISLIYVTFPSKEVAEEISSILIQEDYAKCVNMFNISSMYKWNNELKNENEIVCIYKLNSLIFDKFKDKMISLHPYDVPCIIEINPNSVNDEYAKWIGDLK